MNLDTRNEVLFEYLLANARFSLKDLAKILKVSKVAVAKRIKHLEENQYISRYDAIVNWQKLPFIKKVYFIKVGSKTSEFEDIIVSQKPVFSLINLIGLYNYQVWCFFKSKKQKMQFERLLKEWDHLEIDIEKLVFPRVTFFDIPLKLPLPKVQDADLRLKKIDVGIMKHMAQGHGKKSFYQISFDLNMPYDSVIYHGKKLIKAGYFLKIIAQPGISKFTLQTTSLLICCEDKVFTHNLYETLQKKPHIVSDAIGKDNKLLVHFFSQSHIEYRETLSTALSLIPREKIKDVLITYWDKVILNNRYPLEYLLPNST